MLFACGTKLMYSNTVDILKFSRTKKKKKTHTHTHTHTIFLICFPKTDSYDNKNSKFKL